MQGSSPEEMEKTFQKSYVDPAMRTLEQQTIPGVQQRFTEANAGSSSALNQALAQSAADVSTSLGSQYGQFVQGQQGLTMDAIKAFLPMLTQQTQQPVISQKQGLAGPGIGAAGMIGAGAAMSSRKVKENIQDYQRGLEAIKHIDVKKYDYIEEVGGSKNHVGVIAEDLPPEITRMKDGIKHVDLYGLMGILINAVKDLSKKVEVLEAR